MHDTSVISYANPNDLSTILSLRESVGVFNEDEDKHSVLEKVIQHDPEAICIIKVHDKIV